LLKSKFASARIHSLRGSSITPLVLTALLAFAFGAAGHHAHKGDNQTSVAALGAPAAVQTSALQQLRNALQSTPGVASAGASVAAAIAPTPVSATREAELDEGQTFSEMLTDQDIAEGDALAASNALSKAYDMRRLRAGQDFTLSFTRTPTKETLTGVTFQPEDTKEISLARAADGSFSAHVNLIPVTRHRIAAGGEIHSTLYEAGDHAGVSHALMASLIRIYSHNIDFQRDVHPGDHFEVLFDQSRTAKGKLVGDSTIVYAKLTMDGKAHALYRVTFNDGTADYFDERGQSVRRALLRTPVAAAHITSGFGMRIHPLLGYSKMHKGIDFGAPIGTPIFAAGSGTIDEIGFKNGYGRYIRIRHNGTMATAYAHMSRFAGNLFSGSRVSQGQVIGYVGMSGRATGPHLHFEVQVNGQQVNPMSVNAMPTGRTLDGKMLVLFKDGQNKIKQEFEALLAAKPTMSPASASAPAFTPKTTASH
jgi:murein DD-endopeptidase MepM/ murein hydrolase activator NlpD